MPGDILHAGLLHPEMQVTMFRGLQDGCQNIVFGGHEITAVLNNRSLSLL
jgi:hypothetical protein